jgi:Fe2+ or Zn2+ uptake regulation protein
MSDEPRIRSVAAEISRYLAEHPNATDTLEGIANFWVTPPIDFAVVEMALAQLEAQGVVHRVATGGRLIYRRA